MSCNCKNDNTQDRRFHGDNITPGNKILLITIKSIIFLIGATILSIVIVPVSLYILFKVIFIDNKLDLATSINNLSNMFNKNKNDDDDEYEDDDDDEYEYELADVDDITEEKDN